MGSDPPHPRLLQTAHISSPGPFHCQRSPYRSREKSRLIFSLSYLSNTITAGSRLPPGRKLSRNVDDQLSGNLWSGGPLVPMTFSASALQRRPASLPSLLSFLLHECQPPPPSFPPNPLPHFTSPSTLIRIYSPASTESAAKCRKERKKKHTNTI